MNPENARKNLFSKLDTVLKVSEKKFKIEQKKDCTRLKWGRLLVQTVQAYGKLLETEELELRVEELEKIVREGVVIPGETAKPKAR